MNMRIAMLAFLVGCSAKVDGKEGNVNASSEEDTAVETLVLDTDTGEDCGDEDSGTTDSGSDTGEEDTRPDREWFNPPGLQLPFCPPGRGCQRS